MSYWKRKVRSEKDIKGLKGFGAVTLDKQRGFKGCKLGPANAGRVLNGAEKQRIIDEMKQSGRL